MIRAFESSSTADGRRLVAGSTGLREASQHTDVKLTVVAEQLLEHARGAAQPDAIHDALRAGLARRPRLAP
ncbi:hypothetical protein ACIRU3_38455 [Streptomyces sp. NPDC101151]|uniref:hypothetical protein n=1 Tax=Streptomyces sp. NPDC101151 TaxID=3366115 RepID=UPI00382DBCBF